MMKIDFVFLLKAIKENRNITIYKKKKDTAETLRFFSRFFKVHSREDSIIIDLPYVDGYTHKRLEPGDSISVLFHEAGFRFQFETQVQEATGIGAFGKTQIPALKIAWPLEIVDGNRRSLFRASVYLGEAVGVNYFIQRENQPDAPAYEGVEALMIDISENGTAVKINRRINIQIGNRLKITFRLEEEDRRELLLEGTVRHIRQYPGSDVHICGIAFSPQNSPRYKRVLQEITCYTMSLNQENVNFFTVNQIVSSNPYVRKIVDHEVTEEVLDMLLKKKLPLTPEEYLECLAYVMDIEKFETRATVLLKTLSVSLKESYIQRMDANHKVVYCILGEAIEESHFRILAGIINNGYLPV
ncbi:MAG: PilZ domain-containing protein, partial [bacterium]|nr:PilZ domain-containing protein [bacterium]